MKRAILVFFAALAALTWSVATGPAPVARRAGTTPAAILAAPLGPLIRAWRWHRAQTAIMDGRPEEALEALRIVEALDPGDVRAALFRAHVVGRDLAAVAADPDERFARIAEALDVLARAERANGGDPELAFSAGTFLLEGWAGDPALALRFERRTGKSTTAAAVERLVRAAEGAPESGVVRRHLGEARRLRAVERVVRDGDWSAAITEATASAAGFPPAEADLAVAMLAKVWRDFLREAKAGSGAGLGAATNELLVVVGHVAKQGGAGESERWLVASILPSLIDLGLIRLSSDGPLIALSLAEAADSIRRFVDAGQVADGRAPVREILSRTAVVRLLEGVKSAEAALARDADRVAESLLRPFDR